MHDASRHETVSQCPKMISPDVCLIILSFKTLRISHLEFAGLGHNKKAQTPGVSIVSLYTIKHTLTRNEAASPLLWFSVTCYILLVYICLLAMFYSAWRFLMTRVSVFPLPA